MNRTSNLCSAWTTCWCCCLSFSFLTSPHCTSIGHSSEVSDRLHLRGCCRWRVLDLTMSMSCCSECSEVSSMAASPSCSVCWSLLGFLPGFGSWSSCGPSAVSSLDFDWLILTNCWSRTTWHFHLLALLCIFELDALQLLSYACTFAGLWRCLVLSCVRRSATWLSGVVPTACSFCFRCWLSGSVGLVRSWALWAWMRGSSVRATSSLTSLYSSSLPNATHSGFCHL